MDRQKVQRKSCRLCGIVGIVGELPLSADKEVTDQGADALVGVWVVVGVTGAVPVRLIDPRRLMR